MKMIAFTAFLSLYFVIMIPVSWYYDFEDPLVKDQSLVEHSTSDATMRRLKYKKKIKNWQDVPMV